MHWRTSLDVVAHSRHFFRMDLALPSGGSTRKSYPVTVSCRFSVSSAFLCVRLPPLLCLCDRLCSVDPFVCKCPVTRSNRLAIALLSAARSQHGARGKIGAAGSAATTHLCWCATAYAMSAPPKLDSNRCQPNKPDEGHPEKHSHTDQQPDNRVAPSLRHALA